MNQKLIQLLEEKDSIYKSDSGQNNPRIAEIWKELGIVVGENLTEIKNSIDPLNALQVDSLSEAFEDIVQNLPKKELINYFKNLQHRFPDLELTTDIEHAERIIALKFK